MRLRGALGGVLAAAACWPCAAADALPTRAPVAIFTDRTDAVGYHFARLDPLTLRPREPAVVLGEYHGGWSWSPDGSQIAFGISAPGQGTRIGIRVVDLASMQTVHDIGTGVYAGPLGWVGSRQLVAFLADTRPVVADPVTGELERSRRARVAGGRCAPSPLYARWRRSLVVSSESRLHLAGGDGSLRSIRVPGVARDCEWPSLVVDAARDRAWLIPNGSFVVEVRLPSLRVVRHRVRGRSAAAKHEAVGAVALGGGRFALAHFGRRAVPAGVELLDVRAGTRRTIDRRGGGVARAGRTLLVHGGRYASRGRGVRGYRLDGRRRFALLTRRRVRNVQVYSSRYAYAVGPRDVWVIDVRRGRVVHRSRGPVPYDVEILPPPKRRRA